MSDVTRDEFNKAMAEVKAEIADIKDNHLNTIEDWIISIDTTIDKIKDKVSTNRWVFIAGLAIITIITGINAVS